MFVMDVLLVALLAVPKVVIPGIELMNVFQLPSYYPDVSSS